MYWGNATGKLGQTVLSTINGQQITRAYQPNVKNPRSSSQTLQRAKFAAAVKFFKHASYNFFPFAYEDKKKTESYYNAFMRHNTNVSMLLTREAYLNSAFPSIGNQYLLTSGSLQPFDITAPTVAYDNTDYTTTNSWNIPLPVTSDSDTWGKVSSALVNMGYANGDIITVVVVVAPTTSRLTDEPSDLPHWEMAQAVIDTTSSELWINNKVWSYRNKKYLDFQSFSADAMRFAVYNISDKYEPAAGLAMIISRVTSNSVKVSNAYLVNNATASSIYAASLKSAYIQSALNSWGREESDAVLKGAILKNV